MMTAFLLSIPCLFAATVAEVSNWPDEAYQKGWTCSLSGVVAEKTPTKMIIEDSTGRVKIWCWPAAPNINAGDLVKFKCVAIIDNARRNVLISRNLVKTGNAPRKPPEETTIAQIVRGEHDLKSVRVRGMVVGGVKG